jgi:enterochelin esterase-like enzyme
MALCTISYYGEKLRRENLMKVWLPDRGDHPGPYPVLYVLHGGGGDQTTYFLKSRIQQYGEKLPLMIVAPNGERGYCVDAQDGPAHEGHMVHDVIGFVERFLPAIPTREARALTGQSMGGYSVMKLAFRCPDLFGSIVAQGGSFRRGGPIGSIDWPKDIEADYWRLFGHHPEGGPNDIFALAEKLDPSRAPAIRFEVGLEDGLIQHARDLHEHLENLGIAHEYLEYPGGHNFETWDPHMQDALNFMWQTLGQSLSG